VVTTPSDDLLSRARDGDQRAWQELVDRYVGLVWAVTRAYGLATADAADVAQNTWISLARHLPELRDRSRLAGWLATTARHECHRLHYQRRHEVLADRIDEQFFPAVGPEPAVLQDARDRALWRAFAALPGRCQRLLGLLAHAPELTYVQLARTLGLNPNSVGQTRARCLTVLRRRLEREELV
jgi:RNA polymerase sigma factor (sigma-70 family)